MNEGNAFRLGEAGQNPDDPRDWRELGLAWLRKRRYDEAETAWRRAVTLNPTCADSWNGLGMLASRAQRYREAELCFIKAIEAAPNDTSALCNFATILKQTGRIDEAAALLDPAMERLPNDAAVQWIGAVIANYRTDFSPGDVARQHRRFAAALEAGIGTSDRTTVRSPGSKSGRIRVGFLSPDLRRHSVAHFLLPLVRSMDRNRFTVACYSLAEIEDEITGEFQVAADLWRKLPGLSDHEVVSRIRADEIDILIDCGGLFEGARPAVVAMRAAPLQVAWLGYPSDIGLTSLDRWMIDELSAPVGAEHNHAAAGRIARINGCFLTYDPLTLEPQLPRHREAGAPVTFGCFNDASKWNPILLEQWGLLLHEVQDSRLLLKSRSLDCFDVRQWLLAVFASFGISAERIELRGHVESQSAHRQMYAEVDVALDSFPYHGVTSTCEALMMGVPVVTLAGRCHAGRVGVSLLLSAGHPEWVASSFDEYRRIAASLMEDRQQLAALHQRLPDQLRQSELFDTRGFARRFESALHMLARVGLGIPASP